MPAISRYGARVIPNTQQTIAAMDKAGSVVQGPQIAEFERKLAEFLGGGRTVCASYGRMAFLYLLKALGLPAGSEIIFPALTFWVVPEMARVAGLIPVFADIDPATFALDPADFERQITPRTRVVVPTHLYGLPCDMDPILDIARKHNLFVIEDCAHALGARYHGKFAGTLGDASFFSFQTLKPLNTYGGGAAWTRDDALAQKVAALAEAEPWPERKRLQSKLFSGRLQRLFIRPGVFTYTAFPILWTASLMNARPDVYLWEKIRPLSPLPQGYAERYSNVQAAIGIEALSHLDRWTASAQAHARLLDAALSGIPDVTIPVVPEGRTHVYYQYCAYVPDRDGFVKRCIRRGLDVETLHVDVCSSLPIFGASQRRAPGAEKAAEAVQLPVYSTLDDGDMGLVTKRVRAVLEARAAQAEQGAVRS